MYIDMQTERFILKNHLTQLWRLDEAKIWIFKNPSGYIKSNQSELTE